MRNSSIAIERPSKWLVGMMFIITLLLVGAGAAFAEPTILPTTPCPTNMGSCTADDLVTTVSSAIPVGGDSCTDPADSITIDLFVTWTPNAGTRYDVGFYISTDGDPVNQNDNCVGAIAPLGAGENPPDYVFKDLDGQTGDICGDVTKTYPVTWAVRTTVPCQPAPGTNYLQVQACRVWNQNTGAVCNDLTDAGTGSKCDCDPLPVTDIPVPQAAKITVIKDLIPSTDPGRFTLWIDEHNDGTNDHILQDVGDGGTLGPEVVPAGTTAAPGATHKVGETAYTGTDLAQYTTTITCVKVGGGTIGPVPAPSTTLAVQPNDDWTCTITNTRLPDWGDLPESGDWVTDINADGTPEYTYTANFCTTEASNGARHTQTGESRIWLGALIDSEAEGQPTSAADGDDKNRLDDEDGITLINPQWWQGGVTDGASLTAKFSSTSSESNSGYLVVWFDWNHDGEFTADEASVNTSVTWTGLTDTQTFNFTVPFCSPDPNNCAPGRAPLDDPLFYRARLFTAAPTDPTGAFCGEAIGGEVEDYYYKFDSPTAAAMEYFTATGDKRAVTLEWKPVSELNIVGFNVYRAKKVDGPRIKLNETLIPVNSDTDWSDVYTVKDTTMLGARTYYYWLEIVDGSNATALFGPVESRAKKVKFEPAEGAPVQ